MNQRNIVASVRTRLLNKARTEKLDFNLLLTRYTVIAEKFEAITSLGIANSRMKDFFDLWVLTRHSELDAAILRQAVAATFARRGTPLPTITPPVGLSDEFAEDANKRPQWQAFTNRNKLDAPSLGTVVNHLREFLRSEVQTTD